MNPKFQDVFNHHKAMQQQLAITRQMVREERSLESLYALSKQLRDFSTMNCGFAESIRKTSIETRRAVRSRAPAGDPENLALGQSRS